MAQLVLNEHEVSFPIRPVGVKYICELCNNGEMKVDFNGEMLASDPPLIPHKCTNCGGTMHLPKQYPYIEWVDDSVKC